MGLLEMYPVVNIRRNHGLEHATIHVLSENTPHLSMVGRSDLGGFTLYGEVETDEVAYASQEALRRLRAGQASLAVHPRCGTILATTGLMTGLAAFLAVSIRGEPNRRFRWAAIPEAILAATFAALAAQPLGMLLQEQFTVSGQPAALEISRITRSSNKGITVHRVSTSQ